MAAHNRAATMHVCCAIDTAGTCGASTCGRISTVTADRTEDQRYLATCCEYISLREKRNSTITTDTVSASCVHFILHGGLM